MNGDPSVDENKNRGIFSKLKDTFKQLDYSDEEFEDEIPAPLSKRGQGVQRNISSRGINHVSVKRPRSFDDARLAADILKDGHQVIINLEGANHDLSERIIDFLNGVTYALNGFVEKISDRVYLFAPSNVVIDVDDDRRSTSGMFDSF